jgi:integrase
LTENEHDQASRKPKERRDGSGSYFHTKAGWVAQIRYYDEFTGKSKQIRRRAKSRDEAREILKQLRAETPKSTPVRSDALTVVEYLNIWEAETLPVSGVKDSTANTYRNLVRSPMTPTLGEVRLDSLTPREVERWLKRLDQFRTKPRNPKPTKANPEPEQIPGHLLSQSTKRQCFAVLSLAMQTAVRDGLIPANPLDGVTRPRKSRTEVPVMTGDEVEQLLSSETTSKSFYFPLIVFVANTGVRIGEALALRWQDVSLEHATATITRGSLPDSTTKTAAGVRTVPLVPDVVNALKAQQRRQREARLKMGPGWKDTEGLVFTTGEGTPVDAHNARRTLRAALKAAGLPQDRPWHTMRHSLATRLLNRGVPMPVVSQIIGHASIRTTVDIYGHAEPAINARALATILGTP